MANSPRRAEGKGSVIVVDVPETRFFGHKLNNITTTNGPLVIQIRVQCVVTNRLRSTWNPERELYFVSLVKL